MKGKRFWIRDLVERPPKTVYGALASTYTYTE